MNSFKNLQELTQRETDDMNWPISIKEIESINSSLSKQKASWLDGFTGKFHQIFKDEIIPILIIALIG